MEEGGFIHSSPPKPNLGTKTITPIYGKQLNAIHRKEDSSLFSLGDRDISMVEIAGFVSSLKKTNSGSVFVLDDGTGELSCTFWPTGLVEEQQSGLIEPRNIIRCVGSLRTFNEKISILVSYVQLIDFNELMYHLIKSYSIVKRPKDMKEEILNCFRHNQDEKGLHVDIVVKMMKKYSEDDVRKAIEELIEDCHLYSVSGDELRTTL
ncbi:Replication protein A 32 kDa subunit A [Dictyocoela muelleri]|nr:Replication protein A 32 kDa subunit A [Dictyocoela muelleri]